MRALAADGSDAVDPVAAVDSQRAARAPVAADARAFLSRWWPVLND
jgi:hypothetical protein